MFSPFSQKGGQLCAGYLQAALFFPAKTNLKLLLLLITTLLISSAIFCQTYSPPIEFLHSAYGLGYGSKIYPVDQGNGATSLRIAVRGGSTTWTDALIIRADDVNGGALGNIGVGADPGRSYKLAVNGTGIFTRVIVHAYPWPDYVFDSTYQLQPLKNVEKYIKDHHRLAGMPSADSVTATGIDLGANQAALLKKIEELTLYIIQQDKALQQARQQLAAQQDEQRQARQAFQQRIARIERLLKKKDK